MEQNNPKIVGKLLIFTQNCKGGLLKIINIVLNDINLEISISWHVRFSDVKILKRLLNFIKYQQN